MLRTLGGRDEHPTRAARAGTPPVRASSKQKPLTLARVKYILAR